LILVNYRFTKHNMQ